MKKYILFNIIILSILLYKSIAFVKNDFKKTTDSMQAVKVYKAFMPFIPERAVVYFYDDKKIDKRTYFLLHNLFAPERVITYLEKSYPYDYVLVRDWKKTANKKFFIGDTLHKISAKEYDLLLIKIKK